MHSRGLDSMDALRAWAGQLAGIQEQVRCEGGYPQVKGLIANR